MQNESDKKQRTEMCSLDLLQPASTTAATTTTTTGKERTTGTAAAKHLESLSLRLIERIHSRDWTHPDFEELIAEDFKAYLPHSVYPHITSRAGYIRDYAAFTAANPTYYVHASNITAYVDEKQGTAEVWILFRVAGDPDALQRDNVTVTTWKRKLGVWTLQKQTGLRGAGGYW